MDQQYNTCLTGILIITKIVLLLKHQTGIILKFVIDSTRDNELLSSSVEIMHNIVGSTFKKIC